MSNDVRRFDDGMPFWCFLWGAPLELACVLILLSVELGAPSAFAGVATMLLVIPLQACFRSGPSSCNQGHCCPHCIGIALCAQTVTSTTQCW